MFLVRIRLYLVLLFLHPGCGTLVKPANNLGDSFRQCLISKPVGSLGHCISESAVSRLESLDNDPEFDLVDGVSFEKSDQELRSEYNFPKTGPTNFKTVADSFSHVFSRRTMRWSMDYLYPGLVMRVAPSAAPGGVLDFVLDPRRETSPHSLKEASTGRLIARQFVLPMLMGVKLNVASIIPFIFGLLALISKKAVVLSKAALIITSAMGLGTLLLGNGIRPPHGHQPSPPHFQIKPAHFGAHYDRYPEVVYNDALYRASPQNHLTSPASDLIKLHGNLEEVFDKVEETDGRNFAWTHDEKRDGSKD